MKKKNIVFCMMLVSFLLCIFCTTIYAAYDYNKELDKIENMIVTIEPQMKDASLDIQYEITWKVLDSIKEGPLTWVQIGAPNSKFKKETALTDNIAKIRKYRRNYVRIDFKDEYTTGESLTFKYSIHQPRVCSVTQDTCRFEFTPAWFPNMRVENLTIRWKADNVVRNDSDMQEDGYLVWKKTNMEKNEKLTAKIEYDKNVFSSIKKATGQSGIEDPGDSWKVMWFYFCVCIIIIGLGAAFLGGGGGRYRYYGYYGHRGFYGGSGHYRDGMRGCVCACACAGGGGGGCACAGSGRAGCSRKDFYGTKLTTKKIQAALKK